ncbi:MAG TPA: alpha/beta hydrolase [Burkholderiales bacterium]|jgi:phospholipase/carboxylesterase|nr:alpha/beta hydrolase [Burkholderiales bacterium]
MPVKLLEQVEIATGPEPTASVIWMHGLGADGYDFVPIVKEIEVNTLPGLAGGVRFIFPHAPTRPVTINNGMVMRAWYDIKMIDLVRQEDDEGLRASQAEIEKLIAREKERGIAANRIILAGFSQGGAVTLQTGLRHAERLGGLMVLSSYLPLASTVKAEANAANRDVPIIMVHGSDDPVINIARATTSRDQLKELGYSVEWHEYPMEHSVCMEEIQAVRVWLGKVLGS